MSRAQVGRPSVAEVTRVGASHADLRAIEAIARAAFPHDEGAVQPAEELARPWARIWIARLGAEPVGFLVAWHVADELHVHSVATAPAHRRRGVGLALMHEAIAYARSEAIRMILLEVRRSNDAATSLYRKLAFTVLNVRKGYYASNGEDGLELSLSLDPATGAILTGDDEIAIDGFAQTN